MDKRITEDNKERVFDSFFTIDADAAKKCRANNSYQRFVSAYDDIDVSELSDEDLRKFSALCHDGEIDSDAELRGREL